MIVRDRTIRGASKVRTSLGFLCPCGQLLQVADVGQANGQDRGDGEDGACMNCLGNGIEGVLAWIVRSGEARRCGAVRGGGAEVNSKQPAKRAEGYFWATGPRMNDGHMDVYMDVYVIKKQGSHQRSDTLSL